MTAKNSTDRNGGTDRSGDSPPRDWKNILGGVKDDLSRNNMSLVAAGVAFFFFLAVFPAIAALISIYGLVADPVTVQDQLAQIGRLLPPEAYQVIDKQLGRIVTGSSGALGFGLAGGILFSLWSANKGMKGLMTALNIAYHEKETRGFFKQNAISLLLTFLAVLAAVISLIMIGAVPVVLTWLPVPQAIRVPLEAGRWLLLVLLIILGLAVLYRYAPDRHAPRWQWVNRGSILAMTLWLAGSFLFSFYVQNFASYNETYGALGAIIILLLWFFLTAFSILIGAELNAQLERQNATDTNREAS